MQTQKEISSENKENLPPLWAQTCPRNLEYSKGEKRSDIEKYKHGHDKGSNMQTVLPWL